MTLLFPLVYALRQYYDLPTSLYIYSFFSWSALRLRWRRSAAVWQHQHRLAGRNFSVAPGPSQSQSQSQPYPHSSPPSLVRLSSPAQQHSLLCQSTVPPLLSSGWNKLARALRKVNRLWHLSSGSHVGVGLIIHIRIKL